MRKICLSIAVLGFIMPASALACPNWANSSIVPSCESGVKVYRGTPLAAPAVQVTEHHNASSDRLNEQRLALQSERLASQSERIDGLQNALDKSNEPRRSSRYGRLYSAPVGAFGTGQRIRGPRTRGRGYSKHRSSGIRVSYNRRRL